jgi:hypothetical protein
VACGSTSLFLEATLYNKTLFIRQLLASIIAAYMENARCRSSDFRNSVGNGGFICVLRRERKSLGSILKFSCCFAFRFGTNSSIRLGNLNLSASRLPEVIEGAELRV